VTRRSAWTFQVDDYGLRVLRKYFLLAEKGFVEDGIDMLDGTGKIPYDIWLGITENPKWYAVYKPILPQCISLGGLEGPGFRGFNRQLPLHRWISGAMGG